MKQIFTCLVVLVFFIACNNNEQPITKIDTPTKEKEMKDAISKFPDSMQLREHLIQYYEDNGSIELALAAMNNALQIDSGDTRFWDKKAQLHLYNNDTLNAIKSYEKAASIYPDPQFIMSAGLLYAKKNNSIALTIADVLASNKKANALKEAQLIKGIYFSKSGDVNTALNYFDKSLSLDYTFMLAYKEKASLLFDLSKFDEAIKVLKKAVTLQNNYEDGYYWLGKCYEKLNDSANAIENYRKAIFYFPDFDEAKDALGKLGVK